MTDGAATATFDVPGSVGGKPLQGTVRVDATWGTTTEDAKITVTGSELTPSVSDVLPNESITISGNGYGTQSCINVADITLDNVALQVDSESTIRCTTGTGKTPRPSMPWKFPTPVSSSPPSPVAQGSGL